MITSTMQDDYQLTTTAMLQHGAQVYPDSEVVTWAGNGARRATFAEVAANANRFAAALTELGIGVGDAVATFCWNTAEHVECTP
jgi:fatty-acyl-CoA synthase